MNHRFHGVSTDIVVRAVESIAMMTMVADAGGYMASCSTVSGALEEAKMVNRRAGQGNV
jgi:hypothetical protein